MKNRHILDYIKIAKGKDFTNISKRCNFILDSDISIKNYMLAMLELRDDIEDIWSILVLLFADIKDDKELIKTLDLLVDILKNYKRYLSKEDVKRAIDVMHTHIVYQYNGRNTYNSTKQLRLVCGCKEIELDNKVYRISSSKFDNIMTLINKNDWLDHEKYVGFVIFKDNSYELIKCYSLDHKREVTKEIIDTYNYDLAIGVWYD